jgi:hypothetical protein
VTIVYFTLEFVAFSLSNAQVEAIGALYMEARDELLVLLSRVDASMQNHFSSQVELLSSLANCDRYKARFLGFPITFGVMRTLAATGVTLGIGLWSILRSAGIFVTIESYCPMR